MAVNRRVGSSSPHPFSRWSIAITAFATLVALCVTHGLRAGVIDGPVVNPANGHAYYLLDADTWTNSESQAEALGGHLATVNDAAENAWVFSTFEKFGGVDRYLWIGLHDPANDFVTGSAHEALFTWADGSTSTYRNWGPAQPDNNGAREFYGMVWRAGDPQATNPSSGGDTLGPPAAAASCSSSA
jgi:hypothetical protein